MTVTIDESNLKTGLLGLVVALVEIIQELAERQAIRRMDGGNLSDAEIERLGDAFLQLDETILKIKEDNGLEDAVKTVRDGLDDLVDDLLEPFLDPELVESRGHLTDCR